MMKFKQGDLVEIGKDWMKGYFPGLGIIVETRYEGTSVVGYEVYWSCEERVRFVFESEIRHAV